MVSKFPHCKRDSREGGRQKEGRKGKKERGKEREEERERPEGVISLAPLQMPKTTTCEQKITEVLSGGKGNGRQVRPKDATSARATASWC